MRPAGAAQPPFRRVCIAGVGLIGGSIARRLRRVWPDIAITGVDRAAVLDTDEARQLLTSCIRTEGLRDAASSCDLTILASPVPAILAQLRQLAGINSLVTDVGSTKRAVMDAAASAGVQRFIGGHPLAGSERSGLAHAHGDLFSARRWFLVHGTTTDADAHCLATFVVGLGAEPVWMDAASHDRAMAFVSHLPQVVAVALHNAAAEALGVHAHASGGRAFFEMTRLAASAPDVWDGILSTNADFVGEAVAAMTRQLPADVPSLQDGGWVHDAFERASRSRKVEG